MEANKYDKDGFYLACGGLLGSHIMAKTTDQSVIFKVYYEYQSKMNIDGRHEVFEVGHNEELNLFPTGRLEGVNSAVAFWVSQRQHWISFLFAKTGFVIDEEETNWQEERMCYSPPYMLTTKSKPNHKDLASAEEAGLLVRALWEYPDHSQDFVEYIRSIQRES